VKEFIKCSKTLTPDQWSQKLSNLIQEAVDTKYVIEALAKSYVDNMKERKRALKKGKSEIVRARDAYELEKKHIDYMQSIQGNTEKLAYLKGHFPSPILQTLNEEQGAKLIKDVSKVFGKSWIGEIKDKVLSKTRKSANEREERDVSVNNQKSRIKTFFSKFSKRNTPSDGSDGSEANILNQNNLDQSAPKRTTTGSTTREASVPLHTIPTKADKEPESLLNRIKNVFTPNSRKKSANKGKRTDTAETEKTGFPNPAFASTLNQTTRKSEIERMPDPIIDLGLGDDPPTSRLVAPPQTIEAPPQANPSTEANRNLSMGKANLGPDV
jgi:FtsZ-binding cell division protein ZapB